MTKYNKKGKTKKIFPITQYRFDTTQHPILNSTDKCASSLSSMLSPQEGQMLEGLANTLQCSERDAIRIALYEVAHAAVETLEDARDRSTPGTKITGHTARKRPLTARLPKPEKDKALKVAKTLRVTEKQLIRLALIWLARGIRSDEIKRLTKSKRLTQEQCFETWKQSYDGSTSKLKDLKAAHKVAYDESAEAGMRRDQMIYDARGELMDRMRWEGSPELSALKGMLSDGFDLASNLDSRLDMEANEAWESFLDSLKPLSREQRYDQLVAKYATDCPNAPRDEIEFLAAARVAEMEEEEEAELTAEELEQIAAEVSALWEDDEPARPKLGALELKYSRKPQPEPISDEDLVQRIYQERLKKEQEKEANQ